MILELQQVLWLDTPRGLALAKFMVDRGVDSDLEWVTVINETGEVCSFDNSEVLVCKSYTLERRTDWSKFKSKVTRRPVVRSKPPRSIGRLLRTSK